MNVLSRDFTLREKILLLVMAMVLIVIVYYWFVDKPVRVAIEKSRAEQRAMETELQAAEKRVNELRRMQSELDGIMEGGKVSVMGSYNNSKEELRLLNDILNGTRQYSISFADVTRDGDQIRRDFTLNFTASDYNTVKQIISKLSDSELRCLIGDIRCAATGNNSGNWVSVIATATFYETMVGGTPDAGLPADKAAAK